LTSPPAPLLLGEGSKNPPYSLLLPRLLGEQGGFIQREEKLKIGFKASLRFGERFGEGSKSMVIYEKSRLMYFSFFV
jgi:hypothetical protein